MNRTERIKMVKAMEYIARQINAEDVFYGWLMVGVADGDIPYGDLTAADDDNDEAYYYTDDAQFSELMFHFLRKMRQAGADGGLACDGVCSGEIIRRYEVTMTYWVLDQNETTQVATCRVLAKDGDGAERIAIGRLMQELRYEHKGCAVTIDKVEVREVEE